MGFATAGYSPECFARALNLAIPPSDENPLITSFFNPCNIIPMASSIARLAARRLAGLPANPAEVVWRRAMGTKVLEEQEHAVENVYFQRVEHEKLEKLKAQLEAHKEEAAAHAASAHEALKAAKEAQKAAESAKPASDGGSGSTMSFAAGTVVGGLLVWLLKP
ncbi:unnamed protein product [Closterium sp. NIES-53]